MDGTIAEPVIVGEVETPAEPVKVSESLTNRTTVRALCAVFQETEDAVRSAFAVLSRAEERVNAAFTLGEWRTIRVDPSRSGHSGCAFDEPDACIDRMRRAAWDVIVDRLEIRRVMSSADAKKLTEEIAREDAGRLPLTEENVLALARQYAGDLPAIFRKKVTESFEWIRPREHTRRAEYKTNGKNARLEIGPKVVLSSMVERNYCGSGKWHVNYYRHQDLTALESVFSTLDGQGWGTRTHHGELHDAIGASEDGTGETSYFRFRCFKNGNLHLEFRRLDLLAKFNALAGGQNLKPGEEQ